MNTLHTRPVPDYGIYWKAWFVLLLVTLAMVFIGSKPILALGMCVKAGTIALLFMHLKDESRALICTVLLGMLVTAAILVVLLIPDGLGM